MTVLLVEQNAFHALKLAHRGYVHGQRQDHARRAPARELLANQRCAPPISKAAHQ